MSGREERVLEWRSKSKRRGYEAEFDQSVRWSTEINWLKSKVVCLRSDLPNHQSNSVS